MPSSRLAFAQVASRRFACFRVPEFRVFAVQAALWAGFDSRQLHLKTAGQSSKLWPVFISSRFSRLLVVKSAATDRGGWCLTWDRDVGGHVSANLEHAAETFTRVQPRLFGLAYRMLTSAGEAEDVVQEVWLRWQACDRSTVRDPTAFLVTTTTRMCINELQSARARRETYIGPWLPEPVDTRADPALGAVRAEALQFATLILLEKLPPAERAAYILREAFDYPYELIAQTIQVTTVNARQLVSRARRHIASERREPTSTADQGRLLKAFLGAAESGDMADLEELFAADVASYTDGNGVHHAARRPVVGSSTVAQFVRGFRKWLWKDATASFVNANGQPAALISREGMVHAFVTITASIDGIEQLLWVRSPDKLIRIARSAMKDPPQA